MKFEILNVEHGFSAYAIGGDGSIIMFDCGRSQWLQPSDYLKEQQVHVIRNLFIMNYDEDHISDLPNVYDKFKVELLTRNNTMNANNLRQLKIAPLSPAMQLLLEMIEVYTGQVLAQDLEIPGVLTTTFFNDYPTFTDTNNLSLLTFLDIGGTSFVLPGDLERRGWLALLENPAVCTRLANVDVFVASHHGRESGYCSQVFDWCKPSLVVISDGPIKHETQEMAGVYGKHASGAWFNISGKQEWRKVVTTRNDGRMFWNW